MDHLHCDHNIRLTRRTLMAATAVVGTATLPHLPAVASGTPVASSQAAAIDPDRLLDLSVRLAGGAPLSDGAVEPLATLLSVEPGIADALAELEAVSDFTPESLATTSPEAQQVATNILQYWFLGRYNNEPVENRAELFFSLASWQTLPYATQQSLCKSFGYWALEIDL